MKKLLLVVILGLSACTQQERAFWLLWHQENPEAALSWWEENKPKAEAPLDEEPQGVWDRLAQCESGGNWSINTGNGFYGGLQFTLTSWRGTGGSGYPHQASREEQIRRAEILLDMQGWNAWPDCSRKLGLR